MNKLTSLQYRDYCGGFILLAAGLASAYHAQSYQIGSFTRMGPGFFPLVLGLILALTGAALLGATFLRKMDPAEARAKAARLPAEWRGWICICLSVVAFAVLGEETGLVPATFACVFIAALGDRENRLHEILLLATGVTIAGVLVFWWGLGILFPLFSRDFI